MLERANQSGWRPKGVEFVADLASLDTYVGISAQKLSTKHLDTDGNLAHVGAE